MALDITLWANQNKRSHDLPKTNHQDHYHQGSACHQFFNTHLFKIKHHSASITIACKFMNMYMFRIWSSWQKGSLCFVWSLIHTYIVKKTNSLLLQMRWSLLIEFYNEFCHRRSFRCNWLFPCPCTLNIVWFITWSCHKVFFLLSLEITAHAP